MDLSVFISIALSIGLLPIADVCRFARLSHHVQRLCYRLTSWAIHRFPSSMRHSHFHQLLFRKRISKSFSRIGFPTLSGDIVNHHLSQVVTSFASYCDLINHKVLPDWNVFLPPSQAIDGIVRSKITFFITASAVHTIQQHAASYPAHALGMLLHGNFGIHDSQMGELTECVLRQRSSSRRQK
jgi:hypothetical protein